MMEIEVSADAGSVCPESCQELMHRLGKVAALEDQTTGEAAQIPA